MIDRVKALIRRVDAWTLRHRTPRVFRHAVVGFLEHDALQFAGSMAYFAVLSIFQLMVLGVVVGSFFLGEGTAREFVIEQVAAGTPLEEDVIAGVIDATIESRGSMTIISIAFLVWSALGIFSAVSNGIGRAFDRAPRRNFLMDKLVGLLLMSVTGLLAFSSLLIGVVTGFLQRLSEELAADLPIGDAAVWLIGLVLPILLIFLAFWVLYRVVPNRPVTWREVLPGAVVAALLWTALRFGFTWYATSVADYQSFFGPIATGITMLVFLYFASVIVLLGAEFARANALEDETALIDAADPRFLPVPTELPPGPAPAAKRGLPGWLIVGGAAVAGLIAGRLTKRGEDSDDL
jgi:membrane protein